jgi:hypothetical protein
MAKIKKSSLGDTLIGAGVGVVGGIAANLIDSKVMDQSSAYTKAGVKAAIGVALPMLIGGTITESLGASMIGVAGYQLATEFGLDDNSSNGGNAPAAGALTPSYSAALMGARENWIEAHSKANAAPATKVAGTQENNIKTTTM